MSRAEQQRLPRDGCRSSGWAATEQQFDASQQKAAKYQLLSERSLSPRQEKTTNQESSISR